MLREDSVTYTSLPQDEGMTPGSNFITTRSAPDHNRRDCKIAAILTIGMIVAGIGLAATIPFVVKSLHNKHVSDTGQSSSIEKNNDFLSSHLNAAGGNSSVVDNNPQDPNKGIAIHQNSSDPGQPVASTAKAPIVTLGPVVKKKTVEPPMKPHPVPVTFEPRVPTTTYRSPYVAKNDDNVTEPVTDLGWVIDETSTPPNDEVVTPDKGIIAVESNVKGDPPKEGYDKVVGSVTSKPTVLDKLPDTHQISATDNDNAMNKLLNDLYGEEKAKPTSVGSDSWMGPVGSSRYKATLITLASVVAVAVAAVIAAIGWLIHSRIASRRRRINIQNVITDLQSRDKVVLLNSESEEE